MQRELDEARRAEVKDLLDKEIREVGRSRMVYRYLVDRPDLRGYW